MPGKPIPKPAALRQRRNKVSTRATLQAGPDDARPSRAPVLDPGRPWHKMTRRWWHDIWHSPMAPEFLKTDMHGLFRLAVLVDRFWFEPSVPLASEIRQQQAAYGLTPIDRRRLQWEVGRAESATRKPPARIQTGDDPRERLRAVK